MSRILIVEDDETLRGELSYFLIGNGYEVSVITDFNDTLDEMLKTDTELILLDLNLPGIDGQTLLRMYRKEKNTPVIIVTSKDTEMDELICMTYGADDFVSKPYNPALLLLHIEAVLRRNGGDENVIRYRDITLNLSRYSISGNGNEIELSKNECRILNYMFRNSGKIVSRDDIMNYLWDDCEFVDDNTLTVNITRVRHKLAELGYGDVISTKRGQGYYIEA